MVLSRRETYELETAQMPHCYRRSLTDSGRPCYHPLTISRALYPGGSLA
jgi:hypothetical protein